MDIGQAITGNIVLIFAVFFGGLFFGPTNHRASTAAALTLVAICLSWAGWIIYVLVHFISRYW